MQSNVVHKYKYLKKILIKPLNVLKLCVICSRCGIKINGFARTFETYRL